MPGIVPGPSDEWDRHHHLYSRGATDFKHKIISIILFNLKCSEGKYTTRAHPRKTWIHRMREGFPGQGIFKTRPERGVRHTGEMGGGGSFLDRGTSMSEDPRQENLSAPEGLKLQAGQCGWTRVREREPHDDSALVDKWSSRLDTSPLPGTHHLDR